MFTKRCSAPFLISRSPNPVYLLSRSVITSASVAPSADTDFSPFVTGRRIVGTDTETLIKVLLVADAVTLTALVRIKCDRPSLAGCNVRCGLDDFPQISLRWFRSDDLPQNDFPQNDFHCLLAHLTLDDPVGAKFVRVGFAGGHQ